MKPDLRIVGEEPTNGVAPSASPRPVRGPGGNHDGPSSPQSFDDLVKEWEQKMDDAEKALDEVLRRVRG